jgi:CheY-like chemotaxis protein
MKSPSILIATDLRAEAQTVQDVLHQEFARIAVSFNPASAAADFAACQPDVLVLAFSSLALAEQHYAGLYQGCQAIHAQPHRSIVLCEQHELQQTYQRCREGRFDDYVLFWPMVHDAPRLTMAVVHALRDLARTAEAEPAAGMAREVHQIADAQRVLESHTAQGLLQAEAAAKFLTGALAELERGQTQEAGKRLLAARSEVQSFGQWVLGLQRQLEPYGHCARAGRTGRTLSAHGADRGRQRTGAQAGRQGAGRRAV